MFGRLDDYVVRHCVRRSLIWVLVSRGFAVWSVHVIRCSFAWSLLVGLLISVRIAWLLAVRVVLLAYSQCWYAVRMFVAVLIFRLLARVAVLILCWLARLSSRGYFARSLVALLVMYVSARRCAGDVRARSSLCW